MLWEAVNKYRPKCIRVVCEAQYFHTGLRTRRSGHSWRYESTWQCRRSDSASQCWRRVSYRAHYSLMWGVLYGRSVRFWLHNISTENHDLRIGLSQSCVLSPLASSMAPTDFSFDCHLSHQRKSRWSSFPMTCLWRFARRFNMPLNSSRQRKFTPGFACIVTTHRQINSHGFD